MKNGLNRIEWYLLVLKNLLIFLIDAARSRNIHEIQYDLWIRFQTVTTVEVNRNESLFFFFFDKINLSKDKIRRSTKWPKLFRCCSSVFPSQQWRPVVTFERHPAAFGRLFFLFGIGSPLRESSSTNRVWPIQKRLYRSCSSCSFYFTALCANWPED